MVIYIVIFLLFYSASILEVGGLKKNQASWLFLGLAVLLILFVGLRYNTGSDWFMYTRLFDGEPFETEYGYLLLNNFFKKIIDNYYVLQFFVTLFFVFSIGRFYKKEAPYPMAALTLLMSFMLFNILMAQVRQSIAVAIIVLFSNYIFERKLLRFLLVIFVASFFHSSAVAAIPLYFLHRNYGKIIPVLLILVSNIFFFFPNLLEIIVLQIAPILPKTLSMKATYYMGSIFAQKGEFNTGLFYLSQLAITLLLILLVNIKDKKTAFFVNSLSVFTIIKALSISVYILDRLGAYYLVFAIIAFTYILDIKIKYIQLYYTKLIFAAVLLLFFYVIPIRSITSRKIDKLTNRVENYAMVPYYNCIIHPEEATSRKDWNEK